jgi:hypothetical protein
MEQLRLTGSGTGATGRIPRVARSVGWLAGLLVLLVAVPGCTSHAPGSGEPSPRTSESTAVDGRGLRLVESGFYLMSAPPHTGASKLALLGVVVENTSGKQQAESTNLTIQLLDAAGEPVWASDGRPDGSHDLYVPRVQPGGRAGMGLIISNQDDADPQHTPVRMVVTMGASDWTPPRSKIDIAISGVRVDQHADGSADLHYTSKIADLGEFKDIQSPQVSVLFRDSAGKLLGGRNFGHTSIDAWISGTVDHQLALTAPQWKYTVPEGADLSRTEVYGSIDGG